MSEAEIGEGETEDPQVASSSGNLHQLTQTVAASDLNALSLTGFAWELQRQKTEKGGQPTTAAGSRSVSPKQEASAILRAEFALGSDTCSQHTRLSFIHPDTHSPCNRAMLQLCWESLSEELLV